MMNRVATVSGLTRATDQKITSSETVVRRRANGWAENGGAARVTRLVNIARRHSKTWRLAQVQRGERSPKPRQL